MEMSDFALAGRIWALREASCSYSRNENGQKQNGVLNSYQSRSLKANRGDSSQIRHKRVAESLRSSACGMVYGPS